MEMQQDIQSQKQEPQTWPKVAIIVLNWNGWRDTIECLESLQRITYPNYQIIVVDNGSTDDSVEKIKAWARGEIPIESKFCGYEPTTKPVQWIEYDRETAEAGGITEEESKLTEHPSNRRIVLIQTGENLGFAEGNNVGVRYALAKHYPFYLLLNNDTVVEEGFLTALVEEGLQMPFIGIVGGKILFYNDPKRIWYAGGKLSLFKGSHYISYAHGLLDQGQFDKSKKVKFITGCMMLVKREVLEQIGLLDGRLFFGSEDADFCWRAAKVGYQCLYTPRAVIWHKSTSRVYDERSLQRMYYGYLGKIILTKKWLPTPLFWLWHTLFVCYAYTIAPVRLRRIAYKDGVRLDGNKLREMIKKAVRDALHAY